MASEVCPLLGLDDDRGAYLTYPSYENRCYASATAESIALNEQTFFCLGGHMERCPRYQARQTPLQSDEPADDGLAAPLAAAAATDLTQEPAALPVWDSEPVPPADYYDTISYDENFVWEESQQTAWSGLEGDLPPPPPYTALRAGASGSSRRPVWPLLLAAGTLVGVLMLCAVTSAGWIGLRALSSQLALDPTETPALVAGGTVLPPGGQAVSATPLPSATLEPPIATALAGILATQTSAAETATAAVTFPTETPSPTSFVAFESPTFDASTPTPTWTPLVFETPTPRDSPTFFPTNTPGEFPQATATFTPVPPATATPVLEPIFVSFVANPTAIIAGQTSTLTWTVRGVKAIFLEGEPVSGPTGSKIVSPSVTTTYVLRIILTDNTVREEAQTVTVTAPTPSVTPTVTPTPTALPSYSASFAANLNQTSINGTEGTCRVDNGCTLFLIQVQNMGNRPIRYWLTKEQSVPIGWGVYFCWANDCFFGNNPTPKVLNPGQKENVSLNFRIPSVLTNGTQADVTVNGYYSCDGCGPDPVVVNPYVNQQFTVFVILPTPTPIPTGTQLPTSTPTATPTSTPTATPTPTATTPTGGV